MKYFVLILIVFSLSACSVKSTAYNLVGKKYIHLEDNQNSLILWYDAFSDIQKNKDKKIQIIDKVLKEKFSSKNIDIFYDRSIALKNSLYESKYNLENYENLILLRFEEISPNLIFYLSPILWSSHNKIDLHYKVYDLTDKKLITNSSIEFKRGGAFSFNTQGDLDNDLESLLDEVFDE